MWVIFALLVPDRQSEYGSRDNTETGSTTLVIGIIKSAYGTSTGRARAEGEADRADVCRGWRGGHFCPPGSGSTKLVTGIVKTAYRRYYTWQSEG